MNFKDYLANTTVTNWFIEYDYLYSYLKTKFGKWTINYGLDDMDDMITTLLVDWHAELIKIKKLIDSSNIVNDINSWGDKSIREQIDNASNSSNSTQSNSGFNVVGDFSKVANEANGITNSNSQVMNVRLMDEFIKLQSNAIASVFKNIIKDFSNLLCTIIPLGGG